MAQFQRKILVDFLSKYKAVNRLKGKAKEAAFAFTTKDSENEASQHVTSEELEGS